MTGEAESAPPAGFNWQLILADLALILFLVALTGLPAADTASAPPAAPAPATAPRAAISSEVAPAQALFRPLPGGPTISAWLAAQPRDPRATLTIFAVHPPGEENAAWARAHGLAEAVQGAGAGAQVPVRIIIAPGPRADLYASLAYDALLAPLPAPPTA